MCNAILLCIAFLCHSWIFFSIIYEVEILYAEDNSIGLWIIYMCSIYIYSCYISYIIDTNTLSIQIANNC